MLVVPRLVCPTWRWMMFSGTPSGQPAAAGGRARAERAAPAVEAPAAPATAAMARSARSHRGDCPREDTWRVGRPRTAGRLTDGGAGSYILRLGTWRSGSRSADHSGAAVHPCLTDENRALSGCPASGPPSRQGSTRLQLIVLALIIRGLAPGSTAKRLLSPGCKHARRPHADSCLDEEQASRAARASFRYWSRTSLSSTSGRLLYAPARRQLRLAT
jgi:hypothetical protein